MNEYIKMRVDDMVCYIRREVLERNPIRPPIDKNTFIMLSDVVVCGNVVIKCRLDMVEVLDFYNENF